MKNPVRKYTEERPWGCFEQFTANQKSTVKVITIMPEGILSLQYHNFRDEYWYILDGNPIITIGDADVGEKLAFPGDEFFIPRRILHRIGAPKGGGFVRFLEIAFGTFDESDIVRVKDIYNRVEPPS